MSKKSPILATIRITDLKIKTIIGTNDWERKVKQPININLELTYDAADAVRSDDLHKALDYRKLKQQIRAFVKDSHYGLLERLTHDVLVLLMTDSRILRAKVRIDKPSALRFAKSVSVEMSSSNNKI